MLDHINFVTDFEKAILENCALNMQQIFERLKTRKGFNCSQGMVISFPNSGVSITLAANENLTGKVKELVFPKEEELDYETE